MKQSQYLIYNGDFHLSNEFLISPDNHSFRYGDGFFETMKLINGNIIFQDLHFERLFSSLRILQFDKPHFFTTDYLLQQIQSLVKKNELQKAVRIRLTVFRGDGGLYDVESNQPNYLIQSWPLKEPSSYNNQGATIDIYKEARKTTDAFSSIKSNNYLPYAMAALWCKRNNIDDALIINCHNRVAEATTSNLFIVKDNLIKTPRLDEGCIAGVTRRYLLHCLQQAKIPFEETEITEQDIITSDELFLTNAGFYIQWVKQCRNKTYTNMQSKLLYQKFVAPLLSQNENNALFTS